MEVEDLPNVHDCEYSTTIIFSSPISIHSFSVFTANNVVLPLNQITKRMFADSSQMKHMPQRQCQIWDWRSKISKHKHGELRNGHNRLNVSLDQNSVVVDINGTSPSLNHGYATYTDMPPGESYCSHKGMRMDNRTIWSLYT